MQARPYQLECVDSLWNEIIESPAALGVLPTGAGKSFIFSLLLKRSLEVKTDVRCIVLMGRIDLVAQTERAVARVIDRRLIGIYCGSMKRKELSYPVTIASIQSIAEVQMPRADLLIVDEVHNLDQSDGRYIRFIERAKEENHKLKIVGFSATPFRSDGEIFGPNLLFKKVTFRRTLQEMIALGFLVPPVLKASRNEFDISQLRVRAGEYRSEDVDALVKDSDRCKEQVLDALARLNGRLTVAWATANIEHCNLVANKLMALGERVTTVHSKLDRTTRDGNLQSFMTGQVRHMVFVTILSEGWDHPPTDAIILMRPTKSPVLYVQTVGRGLRPYPGKADCLVLDYGQVVRTLGPLDDPNVRGKTDAQSKEVEFKKENSGLKCCPACLTFSPMRTAECPECHYQWPPPEKTEAKLDKKASESAKILSEKAAPVTEVLGPIEISMYEAKSGNLCVKIHYKDAKTIASFWGGVSEFFVTTSAWAMDRLERRLADLQIQLPQVPFEGVVAVDGFFEVIKTQDGKYDRVLSVKRVEKPNDLENWKGILSERSGLGETLSFFSPDDIPF